MAAEEARRQTSAAQAWRQVAPEGAVIAPADPSPVTAPAWRQPTAGIDEPYQYGDIVTHEGALWRSTYEGDNWWSPGNWGWTRV